MKVFSGQAFPIWLPGCPAFGRHDEFGRRVVRREVQDSRASSPHSPRAARTDSGAFLDASRTRARGCRSFNCTRLFSENISVNDAAPRPKRSSRTARLLHQETYEVLVRRE